MSDFDKEDFVAAVHQMVKTVPYGRATSYGAIARAIAIRICRGWSAR